MAVANLTFLCHAGQQPAAPPRRVEGEVTVMPEQVWVASQYLSSLSDKPTSNCAAALLSSFHGQDGVTRLRLRPIVGTDRRQS